MRKLRLYITADGKTAVRAFDEVGDASTRSSKKVEENARKQESALKGAHEATTRLGGGLGSIAGEVGLGGVAFSLADVVKNGMALQRNQALLQNALKNTGIQSGETSKRLNEMAESMSTHGGFGEEWNIKALSMFVRATGDAAKAQRDLQLSTDVARGTGRDFQQVVRAIMLAEQGRTTGLTRLGLAFKPVTTAQAALKRASLGHRDALLMLTSAGVKLTSAQKAQYALGHQVTPQMLAQAKAADVLATKNTVLAQLQQKYKNQAVAYSHTTAGAWSNAQAAFQNFTAHLGLALLPAVTKAANALAKVAGWLSKNRVVAYALLGVVGGLAVTWATVTAATATWAAVTEAAGAIAGATGAIIGALHTAVLALGLAFEAMGAEAGVAWVLATGGIALLVAGVIAGVAYIVTHFNQFKRFLSGVWSWMKGAVSDVVGFVKQHWMLLVGILTGPIGLAVAFIATHLKEVEAFFSALPGRVGHALSGIGRSIARPFVAAFDTIKKTVTGVVNWIWSKFKWVVDQVKHFVGGILHLPGKILHGITHGVGHFLGSISPFHTGGLVRPVRHYAYGGPIGGFGGGDVVPAMVEPGEFVLRKEAVQNVGVNRLNSINASGSMAGNGGAGGGPATMEVTMPVTLRIGNSRILAEEVVHFAARRTSLSGAFSTS